ncbi:paramyosin-like [Panicum miliaceum]|uniref:Paramyosin-like n=1 Tax=Panicum miliaceum TaxID=4540 RepID=A0A3L6RI39_PANMI|nr:paramyosin-like [Panicum miliaceum]
MSSSTSASFQNRSWFEDLFADDRVRTLSHQVSTLQDRVWELEHKNTQLLGDKGKLEKQLEETKAASQAITSQKQDVERSLKGENDKLRSEILTAEEKYRQSEVEVEKLKKELCALVGTNEAAMKAFDAEKEEMMVKAEELRRRVEELQSNKDLMEGEIEKLQSEVLTANKKHSLSEAEVERLNMELSALMEVKEADVKAFDAQNAENMKELEGLKRKLDEIQTNKDLVEGVNEKLQAEILTVEENNSQSEAEVKCLKHILAALVETKEASAKAFDAEKLQASYDGLDAKHSRLNDEKSSVQKALEAEKVEACKLKSKIQELENSNAERNGETEKLKAALEEKKSEIDAMSKDIEQLHHAIAEAQEKNKDAFRDGSHLFNTLVKSATTAARHASSTSDQSMRTAAESHHQPLLQFSTTCRIILHTGQFNPISTNAPTNTCTAEYVDQYWRAQRLEKEKTRLSNEKRDLERRLAENTRAAQASSSQVSALGHKVRELERQNTRLSGDLAKQREETKKAGLLFMDAADRYEQVARKQVRARAAELEDARKASLLLMDAADTYQDAAKQQTRAKEEELEDTRRAVVVLMSAADVYQQEAKKQIKEKVEELKILGAQKAEIDARAAALELELNVALLKNQELEVDRDKVKVENDDLRAEVERLMMELGALAEAGEAAAKPFDDEKTEIMKELEELKMKVEEIQAGKDPMKGENDNLEVKTNNENDKLQSEVKTNKP